MTCEQIWDQIDQSMMDGAEMSVELRAHVDGCAACADYRDAQNSLDDMLAAQSVPTSDDRAVAGIMNEIRADHDREQFRRRSRIVWWVAAALVALFVVVALVAPLPPESEELAVVEPDSSATESGLNVQSIDDLMTAQYMQEIEALSLDVANATAFIARKF